MHDNTLNTISFDSKMSGWNIFGTEKPKTMRSYAKYWRFYFHHIRFKMMTTRCSQYCTLQFYKITVKKIHLYLYPTKRCWQYSDTCSLDHPATNTALCSATLSELRKEAWMMQATTHAVKDGSGWVRSISYQARCTGALCSSIIASECQILGKGCAHVVDDNKY